MGDNDKNEFRDRCRCWMCGGQLIWQSDFNYDEVFGEGEGVVSYLKCVSCGADVQYSVRTDEEDEENEKEFENT